MTLLEYERFSFVFEECVIIHFSISNLSLIHLSMVWVNSSTIRIGIFPIRITDYRYKLIFLQVALADWVKQFHLLSNWTNFPVWRGWLSWGWRSLEEHDWGFSPIGLPRFCSMDKGDVASRFWNTDRPMVSVWDLHVDNAICASTVMITT